MTQGRALAPAWYLQAKQAEEAEALEREAREKEEGTKAAAELGLTLRQFLPESVRVDPHWYVQEYPQGYETPPLRRIAVWAELRLTEDVMVRIKPDSGAKYRVTVPEVKLDRAVVLSPVLLLLQELAGVVDEVRRARAQQEEGERRAEELRQRRERERQEQEAINARRERQLGLAHSRWEALGLGVLRDTRYYLPEPRQDGEESDEQYLARCEEQFEEPLRQKRERELQESLSASEAAAFKPITLYELAWPRALSEEDGVDTGRAWSLASEPDGEGFYPVLRLGHVRRRKIAVTAGALEVTEHIFESLADVPSEAKLAEWVEKDDLAVQVTRLAPCVRDI